MNRLGLILVSFLIVPLFTFSNAAEWYELEELYSTANFDIHYTDDCMAFPNDCVDVGLIHSLGTILEEVRSVEISHGFQESTLQHIVFVFENSAEGIAHGQVSIFNEETEEFEEFQMISFDDDFVSRNNESSYLRSVVVHEFFHQIQSHYKDLNQFSLDEDWVIEGQASTVMDKFFIENDEEEGPFFGLSRSYLEKPNENLQTMSYKAALFWSYVAEQYGAYRIEPALGINALLEFWESTADLSNTNNEILLFNQMMIDLGYPEMTFEDVFKDFVVANYAKRLSGSSIPSKYQYIDETQPPGSYGDVYSSTIQPISGYVFSGSDSVESWGANYYGYGRVGQTSDTMQITVNQITNDHLFYVLLVTRNGDLVDEERIVGHHFSRTLTGLDPADDLILIVAGLDNLPETPAKYYYEMTPGDSFSVDILDPVSFRDPVFVGPIDNPTKFVLKLEVLDSASPVLGLIANDFTVTVDTEPANVITSAYVGGLYFLEVQAPTQNNVGPAGKHLRVEVAGRQDSANNVIKYSDPGIPRQLTDNALVIDKSGSMYTNGKIDAAKNAANLYVNSFFGNDMISLVQYNQDATLLQSLVPVSEFHHIILNQINAITVSGLTSVGDGISTSQSDLEQNSIESHSRNIILLTDGRENTEPLIADIDDDLIMSDIRLDVVLIGNDAQVAELEQLSSSTGGRTFFAFDPQSGTLTSSLANIYRSSVESILNEQRVFSSSEQRNDSWRITESFELEENIEKATTVFSYKSKLPLGKTPPILQNPAFISMRPSYEIERYSSDYGYFYGNFVWHLVGPSSGEYRLTLEGDNEIEYFFETSIFSPSAVTLNPYFEFATNRMIGEDVLIVVSLSDTKPVLDATVTAEITTGTTYTDTQNWTLPLYDDGAHGDGLPNDGVYGNYFTRTGGLGSIESLQDVSYIVTIIAEGDSDFGQFQRESSGMFHLTRESADNDNDDLPDIWESKYGLDQTSRGQNGRDDDLDMDGLTNLDELKHGTSPIDSDTDKGGESDSSEIANGRDPYIGEDDVMNPPLIRAMPKNESVDILFDSHPYDKSLSLYRSLNYDSNYALIKSGIDPRSGNYTDSNLPNNITYYYKLVAIGQNNEYSGFSAIVSATPKEDPIRPWGFVSINDDDKYTDNKEVTLTLEAASDVVQMRISNTPRFEDSEWIPYTDHVSWNLAGLGIQGVFVQFMDQSDNVGGGKVSSVSLQSEEYAFDYIKVEEGIDWWFLLILLLIILIVLFIIIILRRTRRT